MVLEKLETTCERMKLDCNLIPYTKINAEWIRDLNTRPEKIKYMEENHSTNLMDLVSERPQSQGK